ncbi:MAG: elongation factor G [Lachnospirales bacterium]
MISFGAYSSKEVKNIVLMGHSGCGKTVVTESALFLAGVKNRIGKVSEGNTTSDYSSEEIKRLTSISTSIIPIEWRGILMNFIDTPGFYDYIGEIKQGVAIADVALIVISAKSGIEPGTLRAWDYAEEYEIPKMIFINGMDDPDVNLTELITELKETFGKSIAPLQVPIKENGKFKGFVNAIKKEARYFVGDLVEEAEDYPEEYEEDVNTTYEMLREAVAETDETLMEKYFEDEAFTIEEIKEGLKTGMKNGTVTPVICGIANKGVGVRILLNTIHEIVPSFHRVMNGQKDATNLKTNEEIILRTEKDEQTTAFVFKTIVDPYIGKLSMFKVYSGSIKKDMVLYNPRSESYEKVSNLYVLRGKKQLEVDELGAGCIGAIPKLSNTITGDTLCEKDREILLHKEVYYPKSHMITAIKTKKRGEEDKLATAFSKMMEEDKTLHFEVNSETKQTVVRTVGDVHLDVVLTKLNDVYNIEVETLKPIVPYREKLKSKVKVQGKHKKQSGGHGQYGDVHIEFEPSYDDTKPFIFEEKIFGGSVPKNYFPAVEKGLADSCKEGQIAGYPVVGLKATLLDGSYHDVDSSEMAFKMATQIAFKKAFEEGDGVLLEPVAKVAVTVPEKYTGEIMKDLSKRRGKVLGITEVKGKQVIEGEVPVSEMFRYPIDLRAMTQGLGSYDMEIDHYDEVTKETQDKIVAERKSEKEK